ncbi:hypothetical protein L1987_38314 [Smallanthus sonchifolius]|uniref:Uncharacterized protein n=1 Tax=Smallanthus sonchifolius TaxID=185202 RepID=A0ACB9HLC2_9ASTR|nr:hypothetical protein L1987_38314 [Smallanthus sonchifolius]
MEGVYYAYIREWEGLILLKLSETHEFLSKLKLGLAFYEAIEGLITIIGAAWTMEKPGALNFEVGQLAEMKSFVDGYRGAWFRCKIVDIVLEQNKILPEYYDFDPTKLKWEKIYQVPHYGRKLKHIKGQLMVRPQYPALYNKSEMPSLMSISQACVVTDGAWKVGDLVDWFEEGCHWSARVIEVLSDDKVQIELLLPPLGQGGKHEAFNKDLRPFLDWSEIEGWTLPTVDGQASCYAQLVFPTKQGMDLEVEYAAATVSPVKASSTTRISAEEVRNGESEQNEKNVNTDLEVEAAEAAATVSPVNASSTTRISAEGDGEQESEQNEQNMKTDCDLLVESSESSSSLRVGKRKAAERRELNIMHEDTLEVAIIDLEELGNKVKWMQRLLRNDATTSSWKLT